MNDHLYLRLTGLIAFVPKHPISQLNNQLRALLVETEHHAHGSHAPHVPHVPVLICVLDRVDQSGSYRKPDRTFFQGATEMALFYLKGQDVWIEGASADSLTIENGNGGGVGCHTITNLRDFDWTARMETITPGSGTVKPDCLASSGVDTSVAARVRLTEGNFRTYRLATDSSNRVIRWEFKEVGGVAIPHRQALAEVSQLDFAFTGTTINIGTKSFSATPPTPQQTIRLRLWLTSDGNQATVWIKNLPEADIFSTVTNPPPGTRDHDSHFAHFYDLSTATSPVKRIPHVPDPATDPQARCPGTSGPAISNPHCPPALFEPNGNA